MRAGSKPIKRDVPLHIMAARHGSALCSVLPALYHLTGADYTSKVGTKRNALRADPQKYLLEFGQGTKY